MILNSNDVLKVLDDNAVKCGIESEKLKFWGSDDNLTCCANFLNGKNSPNELLRERQICDGKFCLELGNAEFWQPRTIDKKTVSKPQTGDKTPLRMDVEQGTRNLSTLGGMQPITVHEEQPLRECGCVEFAVDVITQSFGMGYDYAIKIDGVPVKSWFTLEDALAACKQKGFAMDKAQAREYLRRLVAGKILETRTSLIGTEYRKITFLCRGKNGELKKV